ncbi:MAG: hypothetical protein BMS9Abin26_2192 [Gammaproteobacteria bacterium]|nr:MAG: hypothetical protein BMS9Abin26_2192 [Gammaproteobacteria bacterium]
MQNFAQLLTTVQNNCHISDARHAGNYSMCIFLLKMREYYRWEHDIPLTGNIAREDVGNWLSRREQAWETLETEQYEPLLIDGEAVDPFDSKTINRHLIPHGFVYNSGTGIFNKPHFFLGSLCRHEQQDDMEILVSGCEYARELVAPPAMLRDNTIFISQESAKRLIWEKIEEWQWLGSPESPMSRAISSHGDIQDMDKVLEAMGRHEINGMILHEQGELAAGRCLGPVWEDMLLDLPHKSGLIARAIRDHLADALVLLPSLIEQQNLASIHFYFANFSGVRRKIYPSAMDAYNKYVDNKDLSILSDKLHENKSVWIKVAQTLLKLYAGQKSPGISITSNVEAYINDKYPL